MKNRYVALWLFFFVLLISSCNNKEQRLNKHLNEMASELNMEAPAQLDENTLFMGAEVDSKNTFKYLYRIINTDSAEAMMDEVELQTKANIKQAFEMNPGLEIFTVNKINVDYIYKDSLDNVIRVIHITPEDYK